MAEPLSDWVVRPCVKWSVGGTLPSWRVQRWIQAGQQGAFEMAFVHEDNQLCHDVAALLNRYETS